MKVLITGGTGSVGRAATERLVKNGWDVRVIGRRSHVEVPGAEYAVCDVTSFEDLCDKAVGCDAIVHLAAVPQPTEAPAPELMRVNVLGTVNVFQAAVRVGILRVVQASSINAFGCWWGVVDMSHLRYFPIDEAHPTFTTDPYSFSKEIIEDIGSYYWRRDGISSVALRLPWVHPAGYQESQGHRTRVRQDRCLLDEIAAMPDAARQARLSAARHKAMERRRSRPFEFGAAETSTKFNDAEDGALCRMQMGARFNFWAFLDERDSAQAIEKALLAEYEGSHVLFVNDSHNWLMYDTERLLSMFYPEVTRRTHTIRGCESLVSIDRARNLIGFEPLHSVSAISTATGDQECPPTR